MAERLALALVSDVCALLLRGEGPPGFAGCRIEGLAPDSFEEVILSPRQACACILSDVLLSGRHVILEDDMEQLTHHYGALNGLPLTDIDWP